MAQEVSVFNTVNLSFLISLADHFFVVFHHDGPFDALNPHRNRQGSRRAPMQAFPEGSLNNTIGGPGPLNSRPDHSNLFGHGDEEAFSEWSSSGKDRNGEYSSKTEVPVFDPLSRGTVLHGDESLGLGTSTFLEGTPAARSAIEEREKERQAQLMNEGLQRKKSLAHRIRNIKGGNREPTRFGSSDSYVRKQSESGPSGNNPFFNSEYRGGDEGFSVRKAEAPGSPKGGNIGVALERRATADGTVTAGSEETARPIPPPPPSKPTGLLGRMKSLKGRRKPPAPPDADAGAMPGTAI